MAISECCVQTNSQGQELTRHGSDSFPVACYQDDSDAVPISMIV